MRNGHHIQATVGGIDIASLVSYTVIIRRSARSTDFLTCWVDAKAVLEVLDRACVNFGHSVHPCAPGVSIQTSREKSSGQLRCTSDRERGSCAEVGLATIKENRKPRHGSSAYGGIEGITGRIWRGKNPSSIRSQTATIAS